MEKQTHDCWLAIRLGQDTQSKLPEMSNEILVDTQEFLGAIGRLKPARVRKIDKAQDLCIAYTDGEGISFRRNSIAAVCPVIRAKWTGEATVNFGAVLTFLKIKPSKSRLSIAFVDGKLWIDTLALAARWVESSKQTSDLRFEEASNGDRVPDERRSINQHPASSAPKVAPVATRTRRKQEITFGLSPDEDRLLSIYRIFSFEDRTDFLYRITRRHFVPYFAGSFDSTRDAKDPSYLHEELESALRTIMPKEILGELYDTFVYPQLELLWTSAWGGIAPVILGATERDGQRADELYAALAEHWGTLSVRWDTGRDRPMPFDRKDALALIEAWRKTLLDCGFDAIDD